MAEHELIAVVGFAGRFPMADDVEAYWANLIEGRECIHDLDDAELLRRGEEPERLRHPSYVRRRPLLAGMEDFDAEYFAMTRRDAELKDPQQRLFLETAHATLQHAGYDPHSFPGSIGVFAGTNANAYLELHIHANPQLVRAVGNLAMDTGNNPDYLSTFVSYKLGLTGPSMTVATACSTSLVAIHLAAQSLRNGECDMALAGGVEVEWPYGTGYIHVPGSMYSADGSCRPFDARAGGTLFGSGVGAVLLKRLSDAVADRDTVYAVIRGSAVNNDGKDKVGFSAPSVSGQAACIVEAMTCADVAPSTVSYVEAHGTATKLGDPIEVKALTMAYQSLESGLATGYCGIGSVKSNVGHLGPAAGAAGFIKTVLALHHEQIPPSINFTEPSPELELETSPFSVVGELRTWPRSPQGPRRAGVSSFGVGGTNAHIVLEEAPGPALSAEPAGRPELVVWSARTPAARDRLGERLAEHFAWSDTGFADAAHTLRVGRRAERSRAALVADSAADAAAALQAEPGKQPAESPAFDGVVLAFPGQGAQYPAMAHGLYRAVPAFRAACDADFSLLRELSGQDFKTLWLEGGDNAVLAGTAVAQPLLYVLCQALARTLAEHGVRPAALIGHSLGELVAGAVGGVFSREDGLRLAFERGRIMQLMPPGGMLAVAAAPEEIEPLMTGGLCTAAVNGPRQVVLSGPREELDALARTLEARKVRCEVLATSHAFHSGLMSEAGDRFREVLDGVSLKEPAIPIVSCAGGRAAADGPGSAGFWADQLTAPVDFAAAAERLAAGFPAAAVVEAGPGMTLTGLLRGHPAFRGRRDHVIPLFSKKKETEREYPAYLTALGTLWAGGVEVDLAALDDGQARRVGLPGYPYQRKRHFIERLVHTAPAPTPTGQTGPDAAEPAPASSAASQDATAPAQQDVAELTAATRLLEIGWVRAQDPSLGERRPARPALTLLPDDPATVRSVLAVAHRAGLNPLRVRSATATGSADPALDSSDREAVFDLVGRLAREKQLPDTVLHTLMLEPVDPSDADSGALGEEATARHLDRGFYSLLWLIQAMQRFRAEADLRSWRLIVLTRFGADVSGAEPLLPARAMVSGLLRTAELEIDSLRCHLVDVGARTADEALAAVLAEAAHPVAALRGQGLWLPGLRPLPEQPAGQGRLQRRGVYLITGGLGALGLAAAGALVSTGLQPRLALLGRGGADTDRARAAVADLTASGAEVEVLRADIADKAQVTEALDRIRHSFGRINGVLHSAGVAGDGLLELRSRAAAEAVLRPKVAGGNVLHRLLRDEPDLDFVVHFSSRAALTGLVGSGDYSAANAYLDALARVQHGGGAHVVSLDWPGWAGAGMAVDGPGRKAGVAEQTVEAGPPAASGHEAAGHEAAGLMPGATDPTVVREPSGEIYVETTLCDAQWMLDEHRIAGKPILPGTGYIGLILEAARAARIVPEGGPIRIRDLSFTAPLTVEGTAIVRIGLRPVGARHHVTVRSRAAEASDWTTHAQAILDDAGITAGPDIDPDEVGGRLRTGEPLPVEVSGGRVQFGPHWANLAAVARRDETIAGRLELPEQYAPECAAHPAHPALLDNATAMITQGLGEPFLPFMYREAVFHRPLPSRLLSLARIAPARTGVRSADVDLYDLDGRLLAAIKGFTMRAVDPGRFESSLAATAPQADPAEGTQPEAGRPAQNAGLLDPADGAVVLLRAIESALPANVAVVSAGVSARLRGYLSDLPGEAPDPVSAIRTEEPARRPLTQPTPAPVAPAAAPNGSAPAAGAAPTAGSSAGTGTQARIADLWTEILGEPQIGLDQDFFELGGNSLSAVQLVARIRDAFGVELSIGVVFDIGTVRGLAAELDRIGSGQ